MVKKNFLTGEYVIFSPDRLKRPQNFSKNNIIKSSILDCPFCLENAFMTFEPMYKLFEKEIRIIENKYPIICKDNDFFGLHYVIIDTKDHYKRIENYTDEHIFYLMKAIRENLKNIYFDKRIRYVQVFKNQGINAGASQEHSHWQILALPILPYKQQKIVQAFKEYEKNTGNCYLCDLKFEENIIEENEEFIAFCPNDSLFSYEINIMPKKHILNFLNLDEDRLKLLGCILKSCIKRLNVIYKGLDYNIFIYSSLRKTDEHHIFLKIIPRIGNFGGFEISTGMFVNSVLPCIATKNLKEAII